MPTIPKINFPHIDIDAPIDAIGNSVFGLLGDDNYGDTIPISHQWQSN